ncbi:MAG TPA: hypothetical protein VHX92_00280 [Rhizomicrobium sp.]|jgi:hypothetical protein|nr:hypothetical protein [Rhizomicrobium sp.]
MRKASYFLTAAFMLSGMADAGAQSLKHCFTDNQFDGWWRTAGDATLRATTGSILRSSVDCRAFPARI